MTAKHQTLMAMVVIAGTVLLAIALWLDHERGVRRDAKVVFISGPPVAPDRPATIGTVYLFELREQGRRVMRVREDGTVEYAPGVEPKAAWQRLLKEMHRELRTSQTGDADGRHGRMGSTDPR